MKACNLWRGEYLLATQLDGVAVNVGRRYPAVGAGVRTYANEILPTYHAGDVLVSIEAQVNGGIGPQRTLSTLIIKA